MHCVDFMKIWITYDKDKSGYLEIAELDKFLDDYLKARGQGRDSEMVADLRDSILKIVDENEDGKLSVNELASFLRVEDNFLEQFKKCKLSRQAFLEIFNHYDKNGDGKIAGAELLAFMRDLMMREGEDPSGRAMEMFRDQIMRVYDISLDNALGKRELELLLLVKPTEV